MQTISSAFERMNDGLVQVCCQFEAILIKQSLVEAGVGKCPRFGIDATQDADGGDESSDSPASSRADILQSLFTDFMAQAIAQDDRSGLGRTLARELEKARS